MNDDTAFDWGSHTLEEGEELAVALGPLQLRMRRDQGEIRLSYFREGEGRMAFHSPGGSSGDRWIRWVPTPGWTGELALTPGFPQRPVVVRPDHEFRLMQESEARIYVRVPLELHVEAMGTQRHTLLQVPTTILSDTWWGSTESGELHYALDTQARRRIADHEFLEHLAVCPVQLKNRSSEDLPVTRISLQTAYLPLYREGTHLWGGSTTVRYRGADEESDLRVADTPPEEAPDAVLIRPPRETMGRGFSARTFARQLRSSLGL